MIQESEQIAALQKLANLESGKSEIHTENLAPQKPIEAIQVHNAVDEVRQIIEEQSKNDEASKIKQEVPGPAPVEKKAKLEPRRNVPHVPMALQPQAGFGTPQVIFCGIVF